MVPLIRKTYGNVMSQILFIKVINIYFQSRLFYYYERRGVGRVAEFDFQNLQLQHNTLVFFNAYAKNNLGLYNTILSFSSQYLSPTVYCNLCYAEPYLWTPFH